MPVSSLQDHERNIVFYFTKALTIYQENIRDPHLLMKMIKGHDKGSPVFYGKSQYFGLWKSIKRLFRSK